MNDTHKGFGWVRNVESAPAHYHLLEQPGLPWGWWRANRRYTVYMLRELSSVFIALWSLRLLRQFGQLRRGQDAYDAYVAAQRRPLPFLFNLVTLLFALLHSVTFLQLAGTVQTVRLGQRKLPAEQVTAGAFAGWAAASFTVLVAMLFGGRRGRAS